MNALSNVVGDHFELTETILRTGFKESAASARRRIILPLHRTQDASVQRMLNFFQPGTYVCPHQHPEAGAIETISVLSGVLGFVLFEPDGTVRSTHRLEAGGLGLIDIEPGVWHGLLALSPDTAILEIKQGPYDANADKAFAPWAPSEGEDAVPDFLAGLQALF
ncbi:MAG: cupin fold WbuC family metalloprotein [Verrucomicrobiales bacterium]|jgi:cupin fold WbuC family metalloprotein